MSSSIMTYPATTTPICWTREAPDKKPKSNGLNENYNEKDAKNERRDVYSRNQAIQIKWPGSDTMLMQARLAGD